MKDWSRRGVLCKKWIDGCEHLEGRREKNSKCLIILHMAQFLLNCLVWFSLLFFMFGDALILSGDVQTMDKASCLGWIWNNGVFCITRFPSQKSTYFIYTGATSEINFFFGLYICL